MTGLECGAEGKSASCVGVSRPIDPSSLPKLPDFSSPDYWRQAELVQTSRLMMGDCWRDEVHLIVPMSSETREHLNDLKDRFFRNGYKLTASQEADLQRTIQSLMQKQQ